MKNAVVSKGEARISNLARERVVVAVIELVALSSHSSMSHDYIGIFMQAQM